MIFQDKTVIITGGSAGVGAATARLFADAGANLVLVARDKKNLEALADELRDRTRVVIFPMDVTDADACVDVFKKAAFEFGDVHILVNNAGYHARGDVANVAADDLARIVDVNLRAPIVLSRIAIPYLKESGAAAIINVGSLAGRTHVPGSAGYSASKSGLRAFTYALAEELRDSGIKIGILENDQRGLARQLEQHWLQVARGFDCHITPDAGGTGKVDPANTGMRNQMHHRVMRVLGRAQHAGQRTFGKAGFIQNIHQMLVGFRAVF